MKRKYLIGIIVIVGAMIFFRQRSLNTISKPELDTNSTLRAQVKIPPAENSETQQQSFQESNPVTPEQPEVVAAAFTEQLKQMNKCFNFQFNFTGQVIEPTADHIISLLRPFVGEGVINMEDWTQRDLQKSDGSMIRVRTEMDYEDETNPVRRVQLYKLNKQGMPLLQQIDPQQSTNPTETFIESLTANTKPVTFESGNRIYYQDGEELVFVEQNGRLNSFTFAKGDRTFTCSMTNSSRSHCQCM